MGYDTIKEKLSLFSDGSSFLFPFNRMVYGSIWHMILYRDERNENAVFCMNLDRDERWELTTDTETELYAFVNDDHVLYSCTPWSDVHKKWEIVYEGERPVGLKLLDDDIRN